MRSETENMGGAVGLADYLEHPTCKTESRAIGSELPMKRSLCRDLEQALQEQLVNVIEVFSCVIVCDRLNFALYVLYSAQATLTVHNSYLRP